MGELKTVTSRSVHFDGSSFKGTVPKEIADRYGLEDGDNLLWSDDGEGEIKVRPPER